MKKMFLVVKVLILLAFIPGNVIAESAVGVAEAIFGEGAAKLERFHAAEDFKIPEARDYGKLPTDDEANIDSKRVVGDLDGIRREGGQDAELDPGAAGKDAVKAAKGEH